MQFVWPPSLFVAVMLAAGFVLLPAAAFAWTKRDRPGGGAFFAFVIGLIVWLLSSGIELAAIGIPLKVTWSKFQYLGITTTPLLWVIFMAQYTHQDRWMTPARLRALWVIPALTLLLAFTNESHRLIWTDFTDSPAGNNLLIYDHGPAFWLMIIFSYACLVTAAILVTRAVILYPEIFQRLSWAFVLGTIITLITSIVYAFGLSPIEGFDITPISIAVAAIIITLSVYRLGLFDLIPIAHEKIVESMGDGVVVLDEQGRVVDINPAALNWLGKNRADAIGRLTEDVFSAYPNLLTQIYQVDETQAEILVQNESVRYLDLRVSPLRNEANNATGRLIVIRDVTDRRQAEELMRLAKETAESASREKDAVLEQLAIQLAERDQLIAELDAYAHTVAHDLKNPVTVIGGYASMLEMLGDSASPKDYQNIAQEVVLGVAKMNSIINSLLLLASARQKPVELTSLDSANIVEEVLGRFATEIHNRLATVRIVTTWPTVIGFAPWVEEVWANFISNALKYGGRSDLTPPQPPVIELGAIVENDEFVRFFVRDFGPGISPEAQKSLFQPFTNLHQHASVSHGLGLSIVQRIVERLGGTVAVESVLGEGSTFSFTLPSR